MGRRRHGRADRASRGETRVSRLGVVARARRSRSPGSARTSSRPSRRGTSGCATRSATRRSSRARGELPPRAGAARRGDLPGEQVRRRRALELGRGRADAAAARDRPGDRRPHRRGRAVGSTTCSIPSSTSATARGTSATCSTSTATSGSRSRPTTPGRRTSTAGASAGSEIQFPETRHYVERVQKLKRIYADGVRLRAGPPIASPTSCSSSASGGVWKPAARCIAIPSDEEPEEAADRLDVDVAAQLAFLLRRRRSLCEPPLDLRRPLPPALAEVVVGAQAAPDLEVDAEPGRLGLVDRARITSSWPRSSQSSPDPERVPVGEGEEELVLRAEVVEDPTAREPRRLPRAGPRSRPRSRTARRHAAQRPGSPPAASPSPRSLSFGMLALYKTVRTYYYRRDGRSP